MKKNQENENYFIGFIIYRPMPSYEKKKRKEKLFLAYAIHLFKEISEEIFCKIMKKNE